MKTPKNHPALKPGHKFSIGWPPGFTPQPYEPKRDYAEAIKNLKKGAELARHHKGAR